MKKLLINTSIILLLVMSALQANCQEVYQKKGFKLTVINQSTDLDGVVKNNLVETFFAVYPTLVRGYNSNSVKEVEFLIDPEYSGVAEAGGRRVRISPHWLKENPDDFDLVTHEVMHLVQSYPNDAGPWWVTEGIADYVRYVNGCDNEKGGWSLTEYDPSQNYDAGYRITARFFLWIENHIKPGFVKQLDHAMRTASYSDKIWKSLAGKNIEDLWSEYGSDPAI